MVGRTTIFQQIECVIRNDKGKGEAQAWVEVVLYRWHDPSLSSQADEFVLKLRVCEFAADKSMERKDLLSREVPGETNEDAEKIRSAIAIFDAEVERLESEAREYERRHAPPEVKEAPTPG